MKSMSHFAVFFAALLMIGLMPVKQGWAADDNASVAQVYLEFDPATGQFKSVAATPDNSPDSAMTSQHSQSKAQKEAMAAAVQDNSAAQTTTAAAPAAAAPAMDTNTAQGGASPMLIGAIVAVVVIGGVFMTLRKKAA